MRDPPEAGAVNSGEGHSVGSQGARGSSMEGPNRERWEELCRQAAQEQDRQRLLELTLEINRLLREKETRLIDQGTPEDGRESS